ncbi:hypothetical protein [Breoghania sp.]|uniref:hypothetical protein n=1 Tax=Breoghania sp. TaxID=2065378 RepID=UPI002637F9BD|nr:hypothetical protein [Breoghania sp.]MDJ0931123.1 hypothetical protein [Breoghania sp.]
MTEDALPFLGIGIMLLGSLLVTINDGLIKQALTSAATPEVLFFRGAFALVFFVLYGALTRNFRNFVPRNLLNAVWLSALAVLSLFLFTYALGLVPLATAIVLAYLS